MVKVSVIVPIYNVVEYLEDCLESLAKQTLDDIEVILVDDGSTDGSGKVADAFAASHSFVSCHHIENGGLGHARNYGVRFAHGEYVCFADSDDVIPSYAYEEMAALGDKHGADMVVGDVVRFNSRRTYSSGLHRRAFRDATEVMHISRDHDLLYDTTAWNKLFRRDFYEREHLMWAEGMLYEDIPVTVPAHWKANKVAYLNKTVYRWRARDGVSASITQRRTEIQNFRDRVKAISMVDDFFKSNVDDHALTVAKDVKWLDMDLRLYVNALRDANDDYADEVISTVGDYLDKVEAEAFDSIRAINRLKFHAIARRDLGMLQDVLQFEKMGMKTLRVKADGNGRFHGDFPFKVDSSLKDMTYELRRFSLKQHVRFAKLDESGLTVGGSMSAYRMDVRKRDDASVSARLVDEQGSLVRPVSMTLEPSSKPHRFNISRNYRRIVRRTNKYDRYQLTIPTETLSGLPEGRYRVDFGYTVSGLSCDRRRLGQPIAGDPPRPFAMRIGDKVVSLTYNFCYDLCIDVVDCSTEVSSVDLIDDHTVAMTREDGSHEVLHTEESLTAWTTFEEPYTATTPVFHHCDAGLLYCVANRHGKLGIKLMPWGALMRNCCIEGSTLSMNLTIPAEAGMAKIHSATLVGRKFGACIPLAFHTEPIRDSSVGEWHLQISIALDDSDQTAAMRDDAYELHIFGDDVTGNPLDFVSYNTCDKRLPIGTVQVRDHRYWAATRTTRFLVTVKRIPGRLDRSKRARRIVAKYVYPMMRLLPLKRKWVVFESFWGRKADCNPGAMYRYMAKYHPEYTCIWSVADPRIAIEGDPRRVVKGSFRYFYVMARAKYLFNNVNFIDAYEKRSGQIEVQTMHGTPLKTLGLDVPGDFPTQRSIDSFLRRCARWDYLVVQSTKVEDITRSCYAYRNAYLETGYPRNDVLFAKNTQEDIAALKHKYGIDSNKKLVLYAPTWRKSGRFDLELDLAEMLDRLGDEYQIGLRVHHLALAGLDKDSLDPRVLNLSYVASMEELFLVSDIVITDYSSLMFDYAILRRPLLFFTYDLEDYRDNLRGFNIDLEKEAPGPLLFDTDQVIAAIQNIDQVQERYADAYARFREHYCIFETGHACEQIYGRVFR